jgi:hypothetical protein
MRGWDSGGADLSTSCRSWEQWRLSAAGAPADDAGGKGGAGVRVGEEEGRRWAGRGGAYLASVLRFIKRIINSCVPTRHR